MNHFAVTTVVFLAILGVLVLIHELGHYLMAKHSGMKVEEFALGFGPRICKLFKHGETQFSVRVFPLGGFVKIVGMEPDDETPGGFNTSPIGARALTIFAGPFMSLVLGYAVFILIGFVWGFPGSAVRVVEVQPKTPAAKIGLRSGDRIVSIDGKHWRRPEGLVEKIHESAGKRLRLEIRRDGKILSLNAVPETATFDIDGEKKSVGILGFIPGPDDLVKTGVVGSIKSGAWVTLDTVTDLFKTLFSRKVKQVGGIVMLGKATSIAVTEGPYLVFALLASLSVTLGVINLFPLPILDGSHLMLLLLEKIRGKKLKPEQMIVFQSIGIVLFVGLALFLVYYDIIRLATGKIQ